MRAAILALLREKRGVLGGGNQVTLGMIRPEIAGLDLMAASAAFMAAVWSLVAHGIIVPGHGQALAVSSGVPGYGSDAHDRFPFFTVTPFGRTLLERAGADPYDRERYLGDARERLGSADDTIYAYLAEGNKNFLDGSYLSASVMLGVSSELLMKWLIMRFIAHVSEEKRGALEEDRRKLWPRTDALFELFIRRVLEHAKSEFPRDLYIQADAHLDLIQTLIRTNRDDVGHGRPTRVDREMVHGHLLNYLTLLKLARELADAFANECNALRS